MPPDPAPPDPVQIAAVRRFGRFYTRHVGALAEGLLDSAFSLPEARVLWELGQAPSAVASALAARLGMDAGHLSRVLRKLEDAGQVKRSPDTEDARRQLLALTARGRGTFDRLDRASRAQVGGWLAPIAPGDRASLVAAMGRIEQLLGGIRSAPAVRPLRPGDLGWVVAAHGRIYAAEYGYDWQFEAMTAGIVQAYVANFDPSRENAWIATLDDAAVGSVFLLRGPDADSAKLRLVIMEPSARGLGLGRRLVRECETFARARGYRRITLSTHSVLVAARALYASEGYVLVASAPLHSFGCDLVEETWVKDLYAPE